MGWASSRGLPNLTAHPMPDASVRSQLDPGEPIKFIDGLDPCAEPWGSWSPRLGLDPPRRPSSINPPKPDHYHRGSCIGERLEWASSRGLPNLTAHPMPDVSVRSQLDPRKPINIIDGFDPCAEPWGSWSPRLGLDPPRRPSAPYVIYRVSSILI